MCGSREAEAREQPFVKVVWLAAYGRAPARLERHLARDRLSGLNGSNAKLGPISLQVEADHQAGTDRLWNDACPVQTAGM